MYIYIYIYIYILVRELIWKVKLIFNKPNLQFYFLTKRKLWIYRTPTLKVQLGLLKSLNVFTSPRFFF